MASGTSVENDPRFEFGQPLVRTPEDAREAFLREEISEKEFRAALGKFGTLPGQIMGVGETPKLPPVDAAFHRSIPDDLREPVSSTDTLERNQRVVDAKTKIREAATAKARSDKTTDETVKRESDRSFRDELEQKFLPNPLTGEKASVAKRPSTSSTRVARKAKSPSRAGNAQRRTTVAAKTATTDTTKAVKS